MFLHLGGEVSVPKKEIMGIFDYETVRRSNITKEFLELAQNDKNIVEIAPNQPVKSFIITNSKVFLSPISSTTLQKRALLFFSSIKGLSLLFRPK